MQKVLHEFCYIIKNNWICLHVKSTHQFIYKTSQIASLGFVASNMMLSTHSSLADTLNFNFEYFCTPHVLEKSSTFTQEPLVMKQQPCICVRLKGKPRLAPLRTEASL